MSKLKKTTEKLIWKLFRIILPKRYLNYYFYNEFIHCHQFRDLSLKKKIWCFRHGFLPREYFQFDLARNDYREYIGLRTNANQLKWNNDFNKVINNKILFEVHMQTVVRGIDNIHVIRSAGYIENGILKSLDERLETGNFESLKPLLEKSDLVLKPVDGARGDGVLLLRMEGNEFRLDDDLILWDKLVAFLKSRKYYLIQERFVQKGISNTICPHSLNTIRICTIIDPVTNMPSVAYAVHRFSSPASGYTDNVSRGGYAAYVDDNGRLSSAISIDRDGNRKYYEYHPVSGQKILDEQLPDWENKKQSLVRLAARMPYFRNIGWDMVLSDNDLYILEGNIPDIGLIQVFKPARQCDALWNFFSRNNFFE